MTSVLPFVLSMIVAMALLPLLARVAGRLRLIDAPGTRKVHSLPIPRVGGIAMAVGVLVAISALGFTEDRGAATFLFGACVIFLFGILDDRFDADYRIKFFGQVAACALPVIVGGLQVQVLRLPGTIEIPAPLSISLTMFFLVGVTNAVNLADGLDGLAGGTAFLCLCGLAWLAYVSGNLATVGLCLAFAGAVLGFLRFNTHPAIVFMGDAGSQLLGYAIGGLSLLVTRGSTAPLSASLPILLLGIPIIDTLQVMTRRLLSGHSPFRADRGHLHHRLLALGFAHHEAVMVIYALQFVLLVVAYFERLDSDVVILATFVVFAGVLLVSLYAAERGDLHLPPVRDAAGRGARRSFGFVSAASGAGVLRIAVGTLAVGLAAYVVLIACEFREPAADVRVALWVLSASMAALIVSRRGQPLGLLDKGVLYAVAAAFVFLDVSVPRAERLVPHLDWALVLLVALATVVSLRSGPSRGFGVTPLDLLVLFITLVVPNLPGMEALSGVAPLAIAKLIVLFYALEVVTTLPGVASAWVRASTLLAVALLAGQALWLQLR